MERRWTVFAGLIAMSYDLRNKVVLITGASSGIGRACGVEFHRAGACVVVAARSGDKLEALAEELGDDRIAPFVMDATVSEQREAAVQFARDRFGPIDVLINNAGWASFTSVLHMPDEHFERMLALNFTGAVALARLALPEMLKRGSGQIINISSVVGTQAIPRMTVYSATKSALNGFSTGLRMELERTGVDVLVVAPGSTNTDFFDVAATVDAKASRFGKTRYTPQRVARAVVRSSRRRRRMVTLTAEAKAITLIRRFSHRIADGIMVRVARKAMPSVARLEQSPRSK